MNPEFDIYEKIDRFLQNRMESEERDAFEKEMLKSYELKEQVEAQRIANMIVLDQGMVDLKAQMQRDMSGSSSSGAGFSAITVAVIGAVMVGVGVAAFLFTTTPSSEKSSPEKNNSEVISGNSTASEQNTSEVISGNNVNRSQKNNETVVSPEPVPTPEEVIPPVSTPSSHQINTPENRSVQNTAAHKNCNEYKIDAFVQIHGTCKGALGWVQISDVKNGQAPYKFALQNQSFGQYTIFQDLAIGSYTITIKDVNGCTRTFPVAITKDLDCEADIIATTPQRLNGGNHTFEPEVDREWNVPFSLDQNATLKIISRSGVTVFENKIAYGSGFAWNGQTSAGINVEAGYYVYTLEYVDGSIEKGTLTILR